MIGIISVLLTMLGIFIAAETFRAKQRKERKEIWDAFMEAADSLNATSKEVLDRLKEAINKCNKDLH